MKNIFFEENYGFGFGSSITTVISNIDYCLENNLIAYINVKNANYSDDKTNVWELIFNQPFNIKESDASNSEKYYNQDLTGNRLNYDSEVRSKFEDEKFVEKYRNIVKNYCTVKTEVLDYVNYFLKTYEGKKILGIHRRGRDHFSTGHASGQYHLIDKNYLKTLIDTYIDQYDYLYLNSDEGKLYNYLKTIYPEKLIYWDDKSNFEDNMVGLHLLNNTMEIKKKMLYDLMIEILILSRCNKQLLMNSNVSHMSLLFSDHTDYLFYDKHIEYH